MLYLGNSLDVLPTLPDNSVDSIITDPPYLINFLDKHWDRSQLPNDPLFWKLLLDKLKPGGYLLAFGATRTHHRQTCAIEDAGFIIRDEIMWVYACVSEDTEIYTNKGWKTYNTISLEDQALTYNINKNIYEWQKIREIPIYDYEDTAYRIQSNSTDQLVSRNHRCLIERSGEFIFQYAETLQSKERVPVLENLPQRSQEVRTVGKPTTDLATITPVQYTGKVWCIRVPNQTFIARRNNKIFITGNSGFPHSHNISLAFDRAAGAERKVIGQGTSKAQTSISKKRKEQGYRPNETKATDVFNITIPSTDLAKQWDGYGTALKPSCEPIILAQKPLDGTYINNIEKWGVGALNIKESRIPGIVPINKLEQWSGFGEIKKPKYTQTMNTEGRWPSNIILDEEAAQEMDRQSNKDESGRFYYVPKPSKKDKGLDNTHITVKPTKLMEYLIKLVTPPKGIVLDPFMGSGSTGVAAVRAEYNFIGIELEEEYYTIAEERINEVSTDSE